MTTTTAPAFAPMWEDCPDWCKETGHPERLYVDVDGSTPDGRAVRHGDTQRAPHWRYAGGPAGAMVAVERASCHGATTEEFRALDRSTFVRVDFHSDLLPAPSNDSEAVVLHIDPARARSLAAAIIRAADLIELS